MATGWATVAERAQGSRGVVALHGRSTGRRTSGIQPGAGARCGGAGRAAAITSSAGWCGDRHKSPKKVVVVPPPSAEKPPGKARQEEAKKKKKKPLPPAN